MPILSRLFARVKLRCRSCAVAFEPRRGQTDFCPRCASQRLHETVTLARLWQDVTWGCARCEHGPSSAPCSRCVAALRPLR